MEDKKKLKSMYDYKPTNPRDPKMPFLEGDGNEGIIIERQVEESAYLIDDNTVFVKEKEKAKKVVSNAKSELLMDDIEDKKKNASSIIERIRALDLESKKQEENDEKPVLNEYVMPDPESDLNILNSLVNRGYRGLKESNQKKYFVNNVRGEVRLKLEEKDVKKIVDTFKFKVVKITSKEVIIKNNKYGFEIYRNVADKRYWVVAVCFEEVWDPKSTNYLNLWTGNAFTGYGFHTLAEVIEQTKKFMTKGKTGNVMWRDYVVDWNKQKNRFFAGDKPKQFTYDEYKKISKWYKENKIWILVKHTKVKDIEDLMEENRIKTKNKEQIPAISTLQAKLLEPPRRAALVFGYPVQNIKYKGKDFVNPENKLYEIGFAFTE